MIEITIIGSGNVAQHLILAFLEAEKKGSEIKLTQVFSRNKESIANIFPENKIVTSFQNLKKTDLYIIAVSDNAIETVANQLPFQNQLIVHTSGAIPLQIFKQTQRGIFYPLMTFTKNKPINFKCIPLCIETVDIEDYQLLEKVAKSISDFVYQIDSEQRKALHVAAVFVNNFTNHLYQIGKDICEENKISFEILKPIILETVQKIMMLNPNEAQTGPAIRNDTKTIEAHESFLTNETQLKIYKILTQAIQDNGKKL